MTTPKQEDWVEEFDIRFSIIDGSGREAVDGYPYAVKDFISTLLKSEKEKVIRECANIACNHTPDYRKSGLRECCEIAKDILSKLEEI